MFNLSNLSKQEKSELLSQLLNDPDTLELSEAEFQDRIKRVVQRLYDAVEEYIKEVDKIRSDERKNLWTTTYQSWISQGRAEVCARMKTILNEIVECPSLTDEGYEVLKTIKKRKNKIVNNEFSNEVLNFFRGRRQAYERLLRFEGKCADALENEWSNAFLLGLNCKDRVTEEQLKKIKDKEKDIELELRSGYYDKNRVATELLRKDSVLIDKIKTMLPSEDNPYYDEIIDFLKNLNKEKENEKN